MKSKPISIAIKCPGCDFDMTFNPFHEDNESYFPDMNMGEVRAVTCSKCRTGFKITITVDDLVEI